MHTAQLIQIVGALLNMGAFALLHFEIAPSSALRYLIPNWLGSVLLVMSAYVDRRSGTTSEEGERHSSCLVESHRTLKALHSLPP